MTKTRKPGSLEAGLVHAMGALGIDGVAKAVGKSEALVRDWSNPDDDSHNVQHRYSIDIDVECSKAGEGMPMIEAHRRMIEARTQGAVPRHDPKDAVLRISHIAGTLAHLAEVGRMGGGEIPLLVDSIRRELDIIEANALRPSAVGEGG